MMIRDSYIALHVCYNSNCEILGFALEHITRCERVVTRSQARHDESQIKPFVWGFLTFKMCDSYTVLQKRRFRPDLVYIYSL